MAVVSPGNNCTNSTCWRCHVLLTDVNWLSYAVDVLPVDSTATMSNATVLVLLERSAANGGPSIPNSPSHDPDASMFSGGVMNSTRLLLDVDHDGAL
jgi:hypothetical protein